MSQIISDIDIHPEIASIMGSDVTPNGIRFQYQDRIKPLAQKQLAMKASGLDPKDADTTYASKKATRKG